MVCYLNRNSKVLVERTAASRCSNAKQDLIVISQPHNFATKDPSVKLCITETMMCLFSIPRNKPEIKRKPKLPFYFKTFYSSEVSSLLDTASSLSVSVVSTSPSRSSSSSSTASIETTPTSVSSSLKRIRRTP